LSIRPRFVEAILRGEKRFEFRRRIFTRPIQTIVVYATVPVQRVVAEFDVRSVLRDSPSALWKLTHRFAGIAEDEFFGYFRGKQAGYAIEIGEVRPYRTPFCPVARFGVKPPQSFAYLDVPTNQPAPGAG